MEKVRSLTSAGRIPMIFPVKPGRFAGNHFSEMGTWLSRVQFCVSTTAFGTFSHLVNDRSFCQHRTEELAVNLR